MGLYQYGIGSDTLVNFTLDELVGGIALIAVGLLMAIAIFGFDMISAGGIAVDIGIVALLIGGGLYVFLGLPLNNVVLILAAVALVPLAVLMWIGAGMAHTGPTEHLFLLLLMEATFVVIIAGAADLIEEIL